MKLSVLLIAVVSCSIMVATSGVANAGVNGTGQVPEPTAVLVWAGLAGAGGLFFWRRNRDEV
jgi:hypothetical protein